MSIGLRVPIPWERVFLLKPDFKKSYETNQRERLGQ